MGEFWQAGKSVGIRVNPECSTQGEHAIYDTCEPGSRLGILVSEFPETLPSYVEGLHFHTLCDQNADALENTLKAVEEKFGKWMKQLKWVNFGGGHHITRADYDRELLISLLCAQDSGHLQCTGLSGTGRSGGVKCGPFDHNSGRYCT